MKKMSIALAVSTWVVSFGFFQTSCTQSDNIAPNCLTIMNADTLRFNLFDMDTKKNLFFSSEPAYEPEQMKLFRKSPTSTSSDGLIEIPISISRNLEEEHFKVTIQVGVVDTLYILIAGQPFDPVIYTVKENPSSPCPQRILDTVIFNGDPAGDNVHNRVVHFYRKE